MTKMPTFILKFLRRVISLMVKFIPNGKFVDFLIWPISKRLFGHGYVETMQIDSNLKINVYGDMEDMVNKSLLFMSGYKKLAWEPVTARLVKSLAPEIKIAVVAGSHLGYYPLIIGANNSKAVVYAFEPNPSNYSRFLKNVFLNKLSNIQPNSSALGDKIGKETMYFDSGQSSFLESHREHSGEGEVFIDTIDNFFNDKLEKPDLMIFDAEGYEHNIIKGGDSLINRFKPDIIFEINPKIIKIDGSDQRNLFDLLTVKKYSLFIIKDNYKHHLNDRVETKVKLVPFDILSMEDMPFVNVIATVNIDRIKKYSENKHEN